MPQPEKLPGEVFFFWGFCFVSFFFNCRPSIHVHSRVYPQFMKREKENSLENITWSELRKQNTQAKKVYSGA